MLFILCGASAAFAMHAAASVRPHSTTRSLSMMTAAANELQLPLSALSSGLTAAIEAAAAELQPE